MATYRTGSRGEEVRQLQLALARAGYPLTADGVYGQRTADAVRAFQRANGLAADGVAGPATLAALAGGSSKDGLVVLNGYISKHITYCHARQVKYIAVHYTAGASSRKGSAMATRKAFLSRNASADFVVDDGQVVQVNPDIRNYYCWAVGDKKNVYGGGARLYGTATNRNTVSIEICSNLRAGTTPAVPNHEGWSFTEAALANARLLIRRLMKEYGIPKENVVRHYDITGKACPGVVGWNDAALYSAAGTLTKKRNDSARWLAFWNSI